MTVYVVNRYSSDLYGRLYYDKLIGIYSTNDLAKRAIPKTAKNTGKLYRTERGAYDIIRKSVI